MAQKFLKPKVSNAYTAGKKTSLSLKAKLFRVRLMFKILGCLAPRLAEWLALRFFLTPPRHPVPEWQKPHIASAKSFILDIKGKTIQYYQWGTGERTILLVHGWGGRGSQLGAFIKPFVNAGYSVLALDGPAHGASSGKQSDMFEFASAIGAATRIAGRIDAIIAHSFGSACTLLALHENKIKTSSLVLIGCPSSAIWITEDFADKLSISRKIVAGMRKQFEHRNGHRWKWDDLSLLKMIKTITLPILIVHDQKDFDVPYQQAVELEQANQHCELFTTDGLGHRRILRSPEVVHKTLAFILEHKNEK